jgi:serine-aspartate repeat-containing protein C/D/E
MSTMTPLSTGSSPTNRVTSGRRKSFAALAAGTLLATGVTIAPSLLSFTGANAATVLQGKTFYDLNKNGVQDVTAVAQTNETAIAGVPVTITAANGTVGTGVSGANGAWTVNMSADGPFRVEFGAFPQPCPTGVASPCVTTGRKVGGATVQFPGAGQTANVNLGVFAKFDGLGSLEALTETEFVEIGDRVWADTNGNGIQDPGEPGIGGVTVRLDDQFGGVRTTVTDGAGNYLFGDLQNNLTYRVSVDSNQGPLAGYTLTKGGQGGRAIDSNPLALDANGLAVADVPKRGPAENDHTYDFGWVPPVLKGSLGDYVFLDANRNGIQDDGDSAVEGATVTLLNEDGTPVAGVAPIVTKADGRYLFTNLISGKYKVKFERPAGSNVTPTIGGQGDPATDSNIGTDGITNTITLGAGQNDLTVDAGWVLPVPPKKATLGDYVFLDVNRNGIQDGGDLPVAGAKVTLLDAAGNPIASVPTQTTGADGLYLFTNLDANTYRVKVEKPANVNVSPTTSNTGTDDAIDSDIDANGITGPVTLAPGDDNRTLDAGWITPITTPKYSLGDRLWDDLNSNGRQDQGEPGIAGAKVELLDGNGNVLATQNTITDGRYTFTGLDAATYRVRFTAPAGRTFTGQNVGSEEGLDSDVNQNGLTADVILVADNFAVDAGVLPVVTPPAKATLGNFVFEDANDNGIQDNNELGIEGVTVELRDASGNVVDTKVTGANGSYLFTNLDPATYSVRFVKPAGYKSGKANVGTDDAKDSDASTTDGTTGSYTLVAGDENLTVDAGFVKIVTPPAKATLGNYVFLDVNRNGIQDAGDLPVAGAKVTLLNADGTPVASVDPQTTGTDGLYLFTNLDANTYRVKVEKPANVNVSPTTSNTGTDDAIDSDINADGITGPVTLAPGDDNRTLDAGWVTPITTPKYSLGDRLWDDLNSNGVQDNNEPGIVGALVELLDGNGNVIDSQRTIADGRYTFTGLDAATYRVRFTAPAGRTFTGKNVGDAGLDSDANASGLTDNIVLVADNFDVDAGVLPAPAGQKYNLGDRLFDDLNSNGIQDANEPGIVGAKVELLDVNGNVLATQQTIADGRYTFFNLNPGQYRVRFTAPTGRAFTSRFSGTDRGLDSNVDGNGLSDLINLTANDLTIDAGVIGLPVVTVPPSIVPPNTTPTTVAPTTTVPAPGTVCVGDKIFVDPGSTGGAQAKDGKGIPGVTVTLVRADGTTVSATTDANGNYKFCGLPTGTYTIKVTPSTLPKGSTNTYDLDGDRNNETKVVLTAENLDVDFGYIFPVVENAVVTTPPPAPTTVPPAPADVLSYTGSESTQRGLMGLSMLLIGFGLVGLARGRRRGLGA